MAMVTTISPIQAAIRPVHGGWKGGGNGGEEPCRLKIRARRGKDGSWSVARRIMVVHQRLSGLGGCAAI